MANERSRDELERQQPDPIDPGEPPTGEVGSEGGSPGEKVHRTDRDDRLEGGSEATETARPERER